MIQKFFSKGSSDPLCPAVFHSFLALSVFWMVAQAPVHAEVTRVEQHLLGTGFRMPLYKWEDPSLQKKAVAILVHGLTQNALSMDVLARKLAEDGYLVFALDQRGHGAWHADSRKGQAGYNLSLASSVRDLKSVLTSAQSENPGLPLFMIGESLGAAVTLAVASETPVRIKGIVLTGCCDRTERLHSTWVAKDVLSFLLNPTRDISLAKYQYEYACENKTIIDITRADPLNRDKYKGVEIAKSFLSLFRNGKNAQSVNRKVDLLMINGDQDKLAGKLHTKHVFDKASSINKSSTFIAGSGHMLLGRPDIFQQTISSINTWLNSKVQDVQVANRPRKSVATAGHPI